MATACSSTYLDWGRDATQLPPTVGPRIWTSRIHAAKRVVCRWPRAHVAQKSFERLAPLIAHVNAAGTVVPKLLVFGIFATLL
jgi:hypothetical protein